MLPLLLSESLSTSLLPRGGQELFRFGPLIATTGGLRMGVLSAAALSSGARDDVLTLTTSPVALTDACSDCSCVSPPVAGDELAMRTRSASLHPNPARGDREIIRPNGPRAEFERGALARGSAFFGARAAHSQRVQAIRGSSLAWRRAATGGTGRTRMRPFSGLRRLRGARSCRRRGGWRSSVPLTRIRRLALVVDSTAGLLRLATSAGRRPASRD